MCKSLYICIFFYVWSAIQPGDSLKVEKLLMLPHSRGGAHAVRSQCVCVSMCVHAHTHACLWVSLWGYMCRPCIWLCIMCLWADSCVCGICKSMCTCVCIHEFVCGWRCEDVMVMSCVSRGRYFLCLEVPMDMCACMWTYMDESVLWLSYLRVDIQGGPKNTKIIFWRAGSL